MYQSQIVIRFQMDGTHYWETCPIEEVAFLRANHHHTFHFELIKNVSHDDRDIELIKFKRDAMDYLNNEFYMKKNRCLVFDKMSCETIARKLMLKFGCEQVSVFEDGTVGGIVKRINQHWPAVTIVLGQTACGKGTFVENEFAGFRKISVSDIVREIKQTKDVKALNDSKDLDKQIIQKIIPQLLFDKSPIVIEGIRQPSILEAIEREMRARNFHNEYRIVWLEVPFEVRKERYDKRNRKGDSLLLEEVDDLNKQLGLGAIEDRIKRFVDRKDLNYQIIKYY